MKTLKFSGFVGAVLTLIGSFLPWERAGGFLGLATNGIRIDFANFKYWVTGIHEFPIYDYGGSLVVLLTLVIVLLAVQPIGFIKKPILWNLILSAVLMVLSLFFVGRGFFHRFEYSGTSEQPTLMIGLICVTLGSAILLGRAIWMYHRTTYFNDHKQVTQRTKNSP